MATEVSVFTRSGVQRVMRYAFQTAQARPRKCLTVVTRSNAERCGLVMWDEIVVEVSRDLSDVSWNKILVDAMTVRMVKDPGSIDTFVATNLHADILLDLAGALAGSLGVAPTGNIDPERRYPSMFEPIHGSAFDITGQGIANPVATFWTVALMREHLGEVAAAARLMRAAYSVCEAGILTPDVGGTAITTEVTDVVCDVIRGSNTWPPGSLRGPSLTAADNDNVPPVVLVTRTGAQVRSSARATRKAILRCLSDVVRRVPGAGTLAPIGADAKATPLDLDAVKGRQMSARKG